MSFRLYAWLVWNAVTAEYATELTYQSAACAGAPETRMRERKASERRTLIINIRPSCHPVLHSGRAVHIEPAWGPELDTNTRRRNRAGTYEQMSPLRMSYSHHSH